MEFMVTDDETDSSLLTHTWTTKSYSILNPAVCATCGLPLLGDQFGCVDCGIAVHKAEKCADGAHAKKPCQGSSWSTKSQGKKKGLLDQQVRGESVQEAQKNVEDVFKTWTTQASVTLNEWNKNLDKKLDQLDKDMERQWNDLSQQVKANVDKIDKDLETWTNNTKATVEKKGGVANVVTEAMRNGTSFVVKKMDSFSTRVENNEPKGEEVHVDEDIQETLDAVILGTSKVKDATGKLAETVKDATVYGIKTFEESELGREMDANTDPEVKKMFSEGVAGVGKVFNEFYTSVDNVGTQFGDSAVRISGHLHGKEVAKATGSVCSIGGNMYKSYNNVVGSVSGAALITNPIKTAPRWTAKELSTFNGCMYEKVHDDLDFKTNKVFPKIRTMIETKQPPRLTYRTGKPRPPPPPSPSKNTHVHITASERVQVSTTGSQIEQEYEFDYKSLQTQQQQQT